MLPDLSVFPFALPIVATPRSLRLAESDVVGPQAALQALLGVEGVLLLQQLGIQRAAQGHSEAALGLLRAALTMVVPGIDQARAHLMLGQTLAYFDRHEEALAEFDAALGEADKDYTDSNIVAAQNEIDMLHQQLCTARALSLYALGRAQAALTVLEKGVLHSHGTSAGLAAHSATAAPSHHSSLSPHEAAYALARARVLLALHRPMDAIALLDALSLSGEAAGQMAAASVAGVAGVASQDTSVSASDALEEVHLLRAAALLTLHRPMLAIASLEARLALNAEDPAAFVLYGQALTGLGEPAFAVDRFEQALRIAPTFAPAYRYMASALVMQKQDQEALSCLRAARRIKPDWPEAWLDEAGIRLRRGELAKGFAAYEWREGARHAATHGAAFWNGDDVLAGQSILILAEQGLGDTLHFVRYLPMIVALAREVIVEVPPTLQRLLTEFGERVGFRVITPAHARPSCERFTLLMSLPHALNTRIETIPAHVPYLGLDLLAAAKVAQAVEPIPLKGTKRVFRVGIVPSGNPAYANDAMRSMPLSALAPLLARDDVDAVLLQAAPRAADQQWVDAHPQWIDQVRLDGDFVDTARVMCDFDLVISVDTALAHLAGAMALPVWILVPYIADWRWLERRHDSPWYPSARLFRQPTPRDWDAVVHALCLAIDEM